MIDRTKYIPPIVSLAGAFVACLVTIVNRYNNLEMMFIVLAALIVFYIAGAIIRFLVNKILIVPEPEEEGSESGEEEASEEGEQDTENENADSQSASATNEE